MSSLRGRDEGGENETSWKMYTMCLSKNITLAETWFIVAFYRQDRRTRKGVRVQTRLSDKMDQGC